MDESEQRLSEALRARATQAGRPGGGSPPYPPPPGARPVPPGGRAHGARPGPAPGLPLAQVGRALLVALLAGAVLGCALALLSVLVPGLLPPLG
ncbi:hypothetical protein [Pseudonocardia sp. H11422]|uniref:hypothetical protein n=1 Tax=Pseudonocardia sp. H11422 TaxID=2835866 RepID=UPI001BDC401C|nr:hypothetical protein [Pseudonocardia sp. H11422]